MNADLQQGADQVSPPRKRRLRSFVKNREGATVIEFALLALPFSLLIFAIIESCIAFASEEYMQNITDDLARQLRTGDIPRTETAPAFKTRFCNRFKAFAGDSCEEKIIIDLRNFPTFAQAAALRTYVNEDKEIVVPGGVKFEPGPAQSRNILRVFYPWPVMSDIMRGSMGRLKDSARLHFATATWQNEPFPEE
jgi:Flp pilus assembly protein TadG